MESRQVISLNCIASSLYAILTATYTNPSREALLVPSPAPAVYYAHLSHHHPHYTKHHVPLHKSPERKHGLQKLGSSPRLAGLPLVVHMHVEVADIHHHRVSIRHIRNIIPPIGEPVLHVRIACALLQPSLEYLRLLRIEERLYGCLRCSILSRCEVRLDGLEVFGGGGCERRDGQSRKRCFEAEHRTCCRICLVPRRDCIISSLGSRRLEGTLRRHGERSMGLWGGRRKFSI